jgi:hypothetical protein
METKPIFNKRIFWNANAKTSLSLSHKPLRILQTKAKSQLVFKNKLAKMCKNLLGRKLVSI